MHPRHVLMLRQPGDLAECDLPSPGGESQTASETGSAHFYVDTAHRAALLYSFALLLVAAFVQLSGWSGAVNMIAAGAMIFYFYAAVFSYAVHGWKQDTDNQLRDAIPGTHALMLSLIAAEIGGWLVLVAGFVDKQVL